MQEFEEIVQFLHASGSSGTPHSHQWSIPKNLGHGNLAYLPITEEIALTAFDFTPADDFELFYNIDYDFCGAYLLLSGGSYHRDGSFYHNTKSDEAIFVDVKEMRGSERYDYGVRTRAFGITIPRDLKAQFEPFATNTNHGIGLIGTCPLNFELTSLAEAIFRPRFQGPMQNLYREAKAKELLALLFASYLPDAETEAKRLAHTAKLRLLNDLANAPTIPELAKDVGVNLKKLKTLFKEVYDTTPYQLLLEARMQRSKELLSRNELSVQEAAWEVGYQNASSFINAFTKRFGERPKTFSKRYRVEKSVQE